MDHIMAAAEITGPAHTLFLEGRHDTPEFKKYMTALDAKYAWFAPGRFLKNEYLAQAALNPELLEKTAFVLLNERNEKVRIEISAVLVPISREGASIAFVDNDAKVIYGEVLVPGYEKNTSLHGFVKDVLTSIQAAYQQEAELAIHEERGFPPAEPTMRKIKDIITDKIQRYQEL
jgi:spermidine synthase